jgi:comEA protein
MLSSRNAVARSSLAMLTAALLCAAWALAAPRAEAQEKKTPVQAQTPAQAKKSQVDVNSADLKTLETLPGVGPATAQRIIEGRPYKTLADLGKVKGLSKAKLDAIKDDLVFGAAMAPPKDAAMKEKPTKSSTVESREPQPTTSATDRQTTSKGDKVVAPVTASAHASGKLPSGEKININKATAEELDSLPGIGPVKARAIIDYRTQNGAFKTIEDIQKVKGIKSKEFSKIVDSIKVTD